jgi:hypothetical protein
MFLLELGGILTTAHGQAAAQRALGPATGIVKSLPEVSLLFYKVTPRETTQYWLLDWPGLNQ